MLEINYINDKFVPTPLPNICADRADTLNLYDTASLKRLAFICAPAGSGKTVTTLLWIKSAGHKSIWFGLDEYDNAPFVFYKMFCTGIMSAQPDNIKMEEILNSPNFFSSPVEHTINLLLQFKNDNFSYDLVLDDFHTITNKKILKSLPFILKRLPHSFNILILSRKDLPAEFEEFAESHDYVKISSNELAFSAKEIQSYYRDLGHHISLEQAQSLHDATGGWAMGINVLSKNNVFESPSGSEPLLERYITKNIWDKWDTSLREFLIRTCIADEMDSELCHILTGISNTDEILDKLLIQNLFAVRTSKHTYRYHHLFYEFLKAKLKERPDINVHEQLLKVADLYYKRGEYFKALDYFVRAENHEGIMMCIPKLNSLYLDFDVEEWVNYFSFFVYDRLSEEFIQQNIFLVMEYAWLNHLNGNAEVMMHYIDIMNEYLSAEENKADIIERNIIGYACIIKFTDFRNTIFEYSKDFSKWLGLLSEINYDDIKMATPTITQNFPYMHRSVFDCLSIIPNIEKHLEEIRYSFGVFFPNEINIFCNSVRAGLYYEMNMLDAALEQITSALSSINKETRFEVQFCISMLQSQILNALGKEKAAELVRKNFSLRITEEHAEYLNPNFKAVDTNYKLWNGDSSAAKEWLDGFYVTDDDHLLFYKIYQYFTTARAFIVISEFEKARTYIDKLKKLSSEYRRPLDISEANVLLSILDWSTGYKDNAIRTMEETLKLMKPYNAFRIIADEGAAVLPILKKIASKAKTADNPDRIDSLYLNQIILCAYEVSKHHSGITASVNDKPIALSKQQMNILTLLMQGYGNADIVRLTGITNNTVKAHKKLIYTKLNVNSAADAVIEAKRRGLL